MMLTVLLMLVILATPVVLSRRVGRANRLSPVPAIDIGVAFVWIVFLYAFIPMLGISLARFDIGSLSDQRLGNEVPELESVNIVGASYAAFMLGFACLYLRNRRPLPTATTGWQLPTPTDLRRIVSIALAIKLGVLLVRLATDNPASADYLGSYTALREAPLLVRQLAGILSATDFAATLLVIVASVAHAPRLRTIVAAAIVVNLAIAMMGGGSRTAAFLYAFAFVVARSIYDRKMRPSLVAAYAGAGLLAFLLTGLVRDGFGAQGSALSLQLLQGGEFVAVFYNALDLLDKLGESELLTVRVGLYLVDLLRLIPQQLIGDLKVDPATLYVTTFYPEFSDAGGGLAFGAIAEATVGFGWPEALVRGALLGWLYASIANHCLSGKPTVIKVFVYVWFVVWSYQAIRDTTFSTVPRFIFQVVPLLVALRLAGTLSRVSRTRNFLRPRTGPRRS